MHRFSFVLPLLLVSPALADTCTVPDAPGRPIKHAMLIIEDNAGDGDIGLQGLFDDEGWTELCVFDPTGTLVAHMTPAGAMGELGFAETHFETREPVYAQWDYAALKTAFPEGKYTVRASTVDGQVLTGSAWFTTVLPMMPQIVAPATVPDPEPGPVPTVPKGDLTVEWMPVTQSQDGRPIRITGYEVWINKENHADENGFSRPNFDVHLGPAATSFTVPAAFFDPQSLYEIEVLAIEESGNQTIGGASFFATE